MQFGRFRQWIAQSLEVVELDVSNNGLPVAAFWNLQTLPKLRKLQAGGNAVEGTLKTEVVICLQRLEMIDGEEVTVAVDSVNTTS